MSEQASATGRFREVLGQAADAVTPRVDGLDRIPADGAAIIAFNHVAPLDLLLSRLVAGRRIHFLGPRPARSGLRGLLGRRAGAGGTPPEPDDLAQARKLLQDGHLLGVFPEGPRSPDGRLYRGDPLVARLALATGVPVVPAAVLPEGGLARALAPRVVIGDPLDLERFAGPSPDDLTLRAATDAVMYALLELSGQTYMDVASGQRRSDLADERRARNQAVRDRAAQRRADEQARIQQRRADREAEASELARAQQRAAGAAREQARRAALADEQRRRSRSSRPASPSSNAPGGTTEHLPVDGDPAADR